MPRKTAPGKFRSLAKFWGLLVAEETRGPQLQAQCTPVTQSYVCIWGRGR
jgi:hypothetical protein